jgi:hypothetical protein
MDSYLDGIGFDEILPRRNLILGGCLVQFLVQI